MRYRIHSADRTTGLEDEVTLEAATAAEAQAIANHRGLLISSIQPVLQRNRSNSFRQLLVTSIALVAFAVGFVSGREYLKYEIRSAFRSAFDGAAGPSWQPSRLQVAQTTYRNPQFDVTLKEFGSGEILCQSYVITNQSATPLTIEKVMYNGEFQAKRGESDGVWVNNSAKQFPVTLSIGDREYIVRTLPGNFGIQRADYTKSIIYLEVYTDRGVFKFSASGALME